VGDCDAELLNADRNAQDGVRGDQVLLRTSERTTEFMSASTVSTCGVVRHLEETPWKPGDAQVSPDWSWS
jgi:hypothetical protein